MPMVLIGVGGSGQHVVHAFLRTLAAANCRPQDVPHVYIVDADASVAVAATGDSQLCANICQLHKALVRPLAKENRAHFALIRPYFQPNAEATPGKAQDNLELSRCPGYLRDIFLTDETSQALGGAGDRTVDLLQGMMANAKVGAMAFGYKLMRCAEDADLTAVNFGYRDREEGGSYHLLKDVQRANVAIVGSSFGGTGSGVIPALVRYLSEISSNGPRSVRAFMTLPWFDIESADGVSAAATQGNSDPKARNSALGLRTYLAELDTRLNRSNYVVAQFPGEAAKRADRGNYNQGEDPHVFNLVLASSILNFLWSESDGGGVDGDLEKRKLLGLITSRDEEEDGQFDAGRSAHLRYRVKSNDNRSLLDIALDAEIVALALEKGAEYIQRFKVEGADSRNEPEALVELAKLIATEYDKKPLIKKGIFPLRKESAPDEVYKSLGMALIAVATLLRESLLWIDQHKISDVSPQGALFPKIVHLFGSRNATGGFSPASEEDLKTRWTPYGLAVKSKEMKGQPLKDSTPRIGQAFTLFLNCFFGDVNLPQEVKALAANQPDAPIYAVVAHMLASLVHQEVIEARAASRKTEMRDDSQDDAPPTGPTTAFFKKIKLDITVESSRSCVIAKGSLDAELGDAGSQSFQTPLHDKHPLSVRHFDPYIGISSSRSVDLATVTKLAKGEGYLPELALRGIPNVAAPLLLQDWRLARGTPSSKAEAMLITPGVRDLKLTDAGLFQHAARIVEAGFWLLFTQDPRVELVDLDVDDAIQYSGFVQLLNRELKSYRERSGRVAGSNNLPRQAIAFKRLNGRGPIKPILVQDERCGWYLAANGDARRFLGELFPELPSVRFGKGPLEAAWRGQEGKGPIKPESGSFEFNMARAFARYLNELVKSGGADQIVGWGKAVTYVMAVLADASLNSDDDESRLVPTGARLRLATSGRGEMDFAIRSPEALLSMSKDLFVNDPVFFFTGDESRQYAWTGVWPLKGVAWEYMQIPESESERRRCPMQLRLVKPSDLGTGERSAWQISSIELNLNQLGRRVISNPFSTEAGARLVPGSSERNEVLPWVAPIWPNFYASGWEYYIAGGWWDGGAKKLDDFDLEGTAFRVDDIEWRIYGEQFFNKTDDELQDSSVKPKFGLIGTVAKCMPVKLTGTPRAVELVMNGRVMGSMPVFLNPLPEVSQSRSCDLAIDFGTSNTCLAIKMEGDNVPRHLPMLPGEESLVGKPLPQFTTAIRPYAGDEQSSTTLDQIWQTPRTPWFFFQSFSMRDSDRTPRSIPSELINLRTGDIKGQQAYLEANREKHVAQYAIGGEGSDTAQSPEYLRQAMVTPFLTPMPPRPGGIKMQDLAVFIKGGLFRDFKWEGGSLKEPGGNVAFRAVYLEQLLVAASASLRWMGIRSVQHFVATYPGAFSDPYREKYITDINAIAGDVLGRTGIKILTKNVIAKSETVSALASVKPSSSAVSVTIDMGGGTTDVGVIVPNMLPDGSPFSYMSSIKYAGNDLLKALLSVPTLRSSLGDSEDDARRLDKLKFMIRAGDSKLADQAVGNVAQAFFEGLFEYVFGLISAVSNSEGFPKDEEIRVHLFGNGFKLTNVFLNKNASDFLASIRRDAVANGMLTQEVANRLIYKAGDGDAKLALIQGALIGAVEKDDAAESDTDRLLRQVETLGHNRVAIWYPCVLKEGSRISDIRIGTRKDRDRLLDSGDSFRESIVLDLKDKEGLRKSFPLTSKYWGKTDAIDNIFGGVPRKNFIALGAYYLQGKDGVDSSFASVVLPSIGRTSKATRPVNDV